MNVQERKAHLLKPSGTYGFHGHKYPYLELAICGRVVNLRIWLDVTHEEDALPKEVNMRIDVYQQVSAPWDRQAFDRYCEGSPVMEKLLKFGFHSPLSDLDEILEITASLKERACKPW